MNLLSLLINPFADLAPKPKKTVTEKATGHRWITEGNEQGPYSSKSWQVEVQNTHNDMRIETVTLMTSAQVGKDVMVENVLVYIIEDDPCSITYCYENDDKVKEYLKTRFMPIVRKTPGMSELVPESKASGNDNTIDLKIFPGGVLRGVGAETEGNLSSVSCRVLIFNEVDRYKLNVQKAGDILGIGKKRTSKFEGINKIWIVSTPKLKESSKVWASWLKSDQRHFYVCCSGCGDPDARPTTIKEAKDDGWHTIDWKRMIKTRDGAGHACPYCGIFQDSDDRRWQVDEIGGAWIAHKHQVYKPGKRIHAGYHISQLYAPWVPYQNIVDEYLDAKESGSTEEMQVFYNTTLGLPWESARATSDWEAVAKRRENFSETLLPIWACAISLAGDTQDNRLEWSVVGWGENYEPWVIEHVISMGDPAEGKVYQHLKQALGKTYLHPSGRRLPVAAALLDVQGHRFEHSMKFCTDNSTLIMAGQGINQRWKQICYKKSMHQWGGKSSDKCYLHSLGSDTAVREVMGWIDNGRARFSETLPDEYFKGLFGKVLQKGKSGVLEYIKKHANEPQDCLAYNLAALKWSNIDLNAVAQHLYTREGMPLGVPHVSPNLVLPPEETQDLKVP